MSTTPEPGARDGNEVSEERQKRVWQAEELFQATFEQAAVGMAHVALDGHFLQVNQKLCEIAGYERSELLKHSFQEITFPDDLQTNLNHMKQSLLGVRSTYAMEKRYLRADGSLIWINLTVSLVRDHQDSPSFFISVIEDIDERKRVEEELERERLAFQMISDNASDIIVRFDRALRHVYINPAITLATGSRPEDFLGKTNEDLGMPEENVALWNAGLKQVLETGQPASLEFSFDAPDGARYYQSRLTAERNPQGEIVSVLSIARDVTNLKQTQAALIQSEARARRLIDSNIISIAIADIHGIFEANDAFLQLIGYSQEDLGRGKIDWIAMTPPEYLPLDEFGIQELRERGVCTPYEKAYLRRDGSRVAILIGAATLQADPLQWVCFILDITERQQQERRLQRSLDGLLMVAEVLVASEDPSADSEQDYTFTQEIARRVLTPIMQVLSSEGVLMTRLSPDSDIIDSLVMVGFEESYLQTVQGNVLGHSLASRFENPAYFRLLQAGEVITVDMDKWPYYGQLSSTVNTIVLVPMRLGEELVGVLTLYPHTDRQGYTNGEQALALAMAKLAALFIERERLQHDNEEAWIKMRAAQEVMQQMDDFLGIASHELKTPLTSLQGNLQLAKRQIARLNTSDGKSEEAFARLSDQLDRAGRQIKVQNRLINDLLDVSRIHANRLELSPSLFNLVQVVREAVEDQHNLSPMRSLNREFSSQEILVFADTERVVQVINNYLSNALKYSESDCPVNIHVTQTGSMARVEVIDEGPGISEDQQVHIWERFFRVPGIEVKSGSGVGLGLGLHICRTIIERQSGQVGVESIPGHGSTFWFTLPLAEPL